VANTHIMQQCAQRTLNVIQVHWFQRQSQAHLWLPISNQQQPLSYLEPLHHSNLINWFWSGWILSNFWM